MSRCKETRLHFQSVMPRAPSTKKERNYILRIELREVENPKVIRTLSVPPSTTFHKFHYALCLAFGWLNCHLYGFAVYNKAPVILPDYPRSGRRPSPPKELLRIDCPSLGDGFDLSDLLKGAVHRSRRKRRQCRKCLVSPSTETSTLNISTTLERTGNTLLL